MVVNMVCYNLCGYMVESGDSSIMCAKPPPANLYTGSLIHVVFHIVVSRVLNVFEPNVPVSNLYSGVAHEGFPPKGLPLIRRIVSLCKPLP